MQGMFAALVLLTVAGCANVNYDRTEPGAFKGEVAVVWLKGTGPSGDGTFVYVPTPQRPLTFTRPKGKTAGQTITPPMMYTDGGSVPGLARAFRGLTPWNYGPAYIVHDWVFMARQCLNTGATDATYTDLAPLTFQDSAEIIAESIKALEVSKRVNARDISGAAVTFAVTSPFSKARWSARECREVSPEHRKMALEAVGRAPEIGDESRARMLVLPDGERRPANAVVVAVTTFD
ncbi:MAG: hypothetical protein U1E69_15395 [Tabrizicola sp.]|uniref:hypothetical protein n=1 Tax=Tabrizicola sp. TaxID=2005166 RepID=UPI002ABCB37B|nr:hypothetical protein [Tabrizicola sp.]MDZ4088173.1 hypothetical protein [Tabrizicola sp.]